MKILRNIEVAWETLKKCVSRKVILLRKMGKIRFGILNNKKIKNLGSYQSRKLTIQEISNPSYQTQKLEFSRWFPGGKNGNEKKCFNFRVLIIWEH